MGERGGGTMKIIKLNPNYNPKPITEGEVWQGHPLFPNKLRDDNEKLLIIEEVDEEMR